MALSVNFWRLGTKTVRVVSADGLADEPTEGVPSGATLWRADVGASRAWNGEAWGNAGGGATGPQGDPGEVGPAGRSIEVFQQAEEPMGAVAGDVWIVP